MARIGQGPSGVDAAKAAQGAPVRPAALAAGLPGDGPLSPGALVEEVRRLGQLHPGRSFGTAKGEASAHYLAGIMADIGLKPVGESFLQRFESVPKNAKKIRVGHNVAGMLEGSDPRLKNEVILVCAHHDVVASQQHGPVGTEHDLGQDARLAILAGHEATPHVARISPATRSSRSRQENAPKYISRATEWSSAASAAQIPRAASCS